MDPEIRGTIQRLDHRIARLQKIKDMLIEEFGVDEVPSMKALQEVNRIVNDNHHHVASLGTKTKKQILTEYIIANGPMRRADLIKNTGISEGTVSYELNNKEVFVSVGDGKWDVTEEVKRANK